MMGLVKQIARSNRHRGGSCEKKDFAWSSHVRKWARNWIQLFAPARQVPVSERKIRGCQSGMSGEQERILTVPELMLLEIPGGCWIRLLRNRRNGKKEE